DYSSRVYLYENDLSYSFNIPAFYDEGFRVYLITHCQITRAVKIQCKAGMTKYFHLDQTGSGDSLIQGSYKSEIRIQILCKI
ncbi:MAG: helix-hairpin-helix domain-containing protein, partial [Bacteroidales bacterium]|nr:helix-hairpin-helix domain-containing protein [Bacteroidales bacterium]